jgi:hypothetical protein
LSTSIGFAHHRMTCRSCWSWSTGISFWWTITVPSYLIN